MADETSKASATPKTLTAAEQRKAAIQKYYDATTQEAKADVVKEFPELASVFSAANHS